MLPERTLLHVVNKAYGAEVHVPAPLAVDNILLGNIAGLCCVLE